ncbi:NmrA family NAD(P)-binding protein [Luteipulveratus sp. YIM 133132]|uniref:NmrA family NAD(P)-binding protein n=1 Tax=Luteipulveratus flavus TaxID=3031728 RepID=A0ABT6C1Z0_9MICO|nr:MULTISPECIES: NmrA family NAD(P)-binding protein [unclassified Luteipulveratus]MDE9364782.1 NmrA family NAD(P)-binding protein [Luteipulveratus sp. YIM 133132]MDF8262660.1 NmrA family NAD(P)-binding protein [Luteipulveratus sp. YIM 133296]
MIVITGATGRLGGQVVERVLQRVPAERVGVSVRDAAKASGLADRGVRVRTADFTRPAGLEQAFEGAERVLVVSASMVGSQAVEANSAAIDAAKAAGAQRILYTSHQAASDHSLFGPQPVHAATERHLAAEGVPYTALRDGFYASTLEYYVPDALETGSFRLPADGPTAWTDHADLADVAAAALTAEPDVDDALDGVSPPLVAPTTWDFAGVAEVLSELTGRTITREVVDDDEWVRSMAASGMPQERAEFTLGMFRAARAGEFDVTDPTLERLIGRPATPVRATLDRLVRQHA